MPKSTKRFTLHTDSLNSMGYRMLTDGARLHEFKANPVMLFNHLRPKGNDKNQILPIGYWDDIELKDGVITGVPVFEDNDEFAMRIYHKVEHGTLRMASVGAKPNQTSSDPELVLPLQLKETVTDWTLKEASIVDIGSNPDALAVVLYDDDDNIIELSETLIPTIIPNMSKEEKAAVDAAKAAATPEKVELSADASATILQLKAENERLKGELTALKKDTANKLAVTLADQAVTDGKILAKDKDEWVQLAEANYDIAAKAIGSIPAHKSAESRIKTEGGPTHSDAKLAKLADKSFDELHKTGDLEYVKLHDKEMYKEKYTEKFGKEPANL